MARNKSRAKRSVKSRKNRWFLPYPALLFLLLCTGVILVSWTFQTLADDIRVTAKIAAPPVTGPAVITSPTDGQHFSSIPVTISGTCPTDGSGGYVKVYRNNVFSGVSMCDVSNNFAVSTDLFPGANLITVQVYNITDDIGPLSTPITVYYDPAVITPAPTSSSSGGGQTNSAPFVISSDFQYVGYYVGQTTHWKINLAGGQSPYAVSVTWGDGSSNVYSTQKAGDLLIEHIYKKPGDQKNHSYPIIVSGVDHLSNKSSLQLFVIINDRHVTPAAASISGATCSTSGFSFSSISCFVRTKNLLRFLWPAYGVVALMTVSYLLGEREEILNLTRQGRLKSRRS